jgi:hypothetical protein
MIARLAGVALDARVAATSRDPRARALAAGWVAANALAARDLRVELLGAAPTTPSLIRLRALDLTGTLAAIAAVPALLDPTALPRSWIVALKLLGMPLLDRPTPVVLSHGASVASFVMGPDVAYTLDIEPDYTVRIEHERRALAA